MKGDFTRFTFQPKKHYSSVLMQQGRVQLDADWNEQMSILNYLNQIQARDIIGSAAGTSQTEGGYQILPAIDRNSATSDRAGSQITDLLITEGRFYIDGILCQLNRGTAIAVEWRSPKQIQVPTITIDGRLFAENQWIELEVPQGKTTQIELHKIVKVNPDNFTLDVREEIAEPQAGKAIMLRLLTTYKTQADYTRYPALSPDSTIYAVYLDVWQRHVTALDDRHLQEVALNGLDTTTRLQTIAQVKLLDITQDLKAASEISETTAHRLDFDPEKLIFNQKPSLADLTTLSAWQNLNTRSVAMTATTATDPNNALDTSGSYQSGDNRLYRVEIHRDGTIDRATFKWSRDNGSIVSAIAKIQGDVVYLKGSIQEEYQLFGNRASSQSTENPWIEITTEAEELDNQPGILVRVRDVKPPNLILLDSSQVEGASLPKKVDPTQAEKQKYKVRRWDGKSVTNSSWQSLERGIQVQFSTDSNATFKTGDYWLISARADQPIDWSRDLPQVKQQLGKPIAQPPAGIQHRYGILAVVKTEARDDAITFSSAVAQDDQKWTQSDLRTKFLPLIDRGIASGIGTEEARLHVQGDDEQAATGKIQAIATAPPKIRITHTKARIFKGYTITIEGKTNLVTAVESRTDFLELTLNAAFDALPPANQTIAFRYQQPIIRFETKDAIAPQFFLNGAGNIGINTFNPTAKLDIQGIATELAIELLQVRNGAGKSLLNVQSDGKVGIGIDLPQANLDVQNTLKITADSNFLQIQPQNNFIRFTTNVGYSFNTTNTGFFRIQPQDNDSINFISNQGYRFDKTITIADGALRIMDGSQENVTLAKNEINVADGKVTVTKGNVEIKKGNVEIKNGILKIGNFEINKNGVASDDTNFNSITVRNRIKLGSATAMLQIQATPPHFNQSITFARQVRVKQDGLIVEQGDVEISGNNAKLSISGSAAIGERYIAQPNSAPQNGLVIQGHVGIGSFGNLSIGNDKLLAKLEIRGTTDDNNDAALNITNQSRDSLFCVRNDGFVGIGTKERSAPLGGNIPVGGNIPAQATTAKLYVKGNAFVDGNIFVKDITGATIEQISSRTLKENIADLSSQEAAEMLNQLHPVKFNYTFPDDRTLHAGFVAEDVPELLASPNRQAVRLLDVVAVLTKTVKDQREAIFLLHRILKQQQAAIAALREKVSQLESEGVSNRIDR